MPSLHPRSRIAPALVAVALLAACGSDGSSSDTTAGPSTETAVTSPETTPTSTPSSGSASSPGSASSTSAPVTLEQPAIFPAADVVYATPEEAATAFVTEVLDVPVNLGEFRAGDSRSGEIDVRFAGEGGAGPGVVRTVLLLRQLGPDDGWFVLAAVNDAASITSPAQGDAVPPGPFTLSGKARGFEGAVTVTASVAGHPEQVLDTEQAIAGSLETPEPFSVPLDLSQAAPGSTVMLMIRGGVGLETDPGETGAIAVTVAG
ncbi:MAG: Gmad2 immunoglobulin-like domain-containing protein [Acidimicrobiia bacterium]|nr:Gmad2 immunoglobulin-like domain-containing protein [Acidimicrobiia bacterium]